MKRVLRRLLRKDDHTGDTLIEVLLAMVAITAVLVGAFVVVQKSAHAVRTGQEQAEMSAILQAQVEQVRSIALAQNDTTSGVFSTAPKYFCINPATNTRVDFPAGYNLPLLASDDFSQYPAACRDVGGRYNLAVTYDRDAKTFNFSGRWDRSGGGRNYSSFVYRIYPGNSVVESRPQCTGRNDVAMVLDSSSSMNTVWESTTRRLKLQEVSRNFIATTRFTNGLNHGSVIEFNSSARTLQPLTGNALLMLSALDRMTLANGTRYISGLNAAAARFAAPDARPGVQKVILFISDGEPHDATTDIFNVANGLKSNGVTIHTVAINTGLVAQNIMRTMAGGPGGTFAPADSEADLERIIETLSNDLTCT